LILKSGDHAIGLFQGMFEKNILTFNPGWDSNARKLATFTNIRELQRQLKAQGCSCCSRQTRAQRDRPASSLWTRMGIRSWSISTCERPEDVFTAEADPLALTPILYRDARRASWAASALFYRLVPEYAIVVGCLHAKRNPKAWALSQVTEEDQ
jgi:hypothetical protein